MQKRATPTAIGRSGGLLRGVALPAPFLKPSAFLKFCNYLQTDFGGSRSIKSLN